MAYSQIRQTNDYIGTNAERVAMSTSEMPAGSTFYETDTKAAYIYSGSAWCLL